LKFHDAAENQRIEQKRQSAAVSQTTRREIQEPGAKGNRTPDLLNAIEALYQLSYDPVTGEGET